MDDVSKMNKKKKASKSRGDYVFERCFKFDMFRNNIFDFDDD